MKICYHGTTKVNSQNILENGFNARTYFATHLEDAIGFGGDYVFGVAFDDDPDFVGWQFTTKEKIPPNQIVSLVRYQPETLLHNKQLQNDIFESNIAYINDE